MNATVYCVIYFFIAHSQVPQSTFDDAIKNSFTQIKDLSIQIGNIIVLIGIVFGGIKLIVSENKKQGLYLIAGSILGAAIINGADSLVSFLIR